MGKNIKARESTLSKGDLQDLLSAIELVKGNGCQGSVKLVFDGSDNPIIQTKLQRQSGKTSAGVSDDIASWPRLILQRVKGE